MFAYQFELSFRKWQHGAFYIRLQNLIKFGQGRRAGRKVESKPIRGLQVWKPIGMKNSLVFYIKFMALFDAFLALANFILYAVLNR